MKRNSFKELEKLEIENIHAPLEEIKSNVNSNLNVFQFAGDIVQLFIPKIFELFLSFLIPESGRKPDPDSKYPNLRG